MRTIEDAAADPLRGVVLDERYRLLERIGRGGMATVYRALDERLDREVAVKIMHSNYADDPDFLARFTREARSAARLNSPEVVAVFDQGRDEVQHKVYLVMEHVRGFDLRALLRERGSLPPDRALSILEPVLSALAAAHAAGIVHRDVKPENVLLGDDGRVKVADFGLARAVEAGGLTATTGAVIGTPAYLAPEQIERGVTDPSTDVYAAGILLWEMLVGRAPVTGDTAYAVLRQHVDADIPPPSSQVSGIPPALDDLVTRATRREPAHRPLDAGAFLNEVRALRGEQASQQDTHQLKRQHTLVVPPPQPPVGRPGSIPMPRQDTAPQKRGLRHKRGLVATAVILVLGLLAGVGGWWFASGRYTSAPSVVDLRQDKATSTLRSKGFDVELAPAVFDAQAPAGTVVDQDPDPEDRVLKNGTITLTVSKGVDLRVVPTLVGLTPTAAGNALTVAGLGVGSKSTEFSDRPKGTVVRASAAAGDKLAVGSTVDLVVSKGVELLPVPTGLAGLSQDEAVTAIALAGFKEKVEQAFDENVAKGAVVSSSPATGKAGRGSAITITVSKGPALRTIPSNLVGMSVDQATAQLTALGLRAEVQGFFGRLFGTVRAVDPGPGTQVERGSTVRLGVY